MAKNSKGICRAARMQHKFGCTNHYANPDTHARNSNVGNRAQGQSNVCTYETGTLADSRDAQYINGYHHVFTRYEFVSNRCATFQSSASAKGNMSQVISDRWCPRRVMKVECHLSIGPKYRIGPNTGGLLHVCRQVQIG